MSQPLPSPIFALPGAGSIATEHQLRQIIDNSNAVIYVKDLQGRYCLVNRAFETFFQLPAKHVLGQTDHQLFPESIAASLRANDLSVASLGQSREFEEQLQVEGQASTYLSSKFPLFDAEGRVTAVCGISTDISDRKKVEDALRYVALGVSAATGTEVFEAIARYLVRSLQADFAFVSRVSDAGPQCLTTLALYYNGKFHTNATYELASTPCQQVFNRAFHFVGSDLPELYPDDMVLKSFGVQSYAGYPLFASDGRPLGLIAAGRCSPMLEDRNRVESVLRVFSVRAAAELQRLDAEASYRAIFEASEDAIFVLDLHSGALVDVNPRACQAYGYSYEEMLSLGVDTFSAGYPPYTEVDAAGWLERARAGEPQRFEWHRRNRDGGLHWDEVFLKRATIGGIDRILAFTREITQSKEAEQALRASEQQYRTIVSTALDCIIGMDSRGLITTFNPAAEQCFGYTREQALGQPWAELMIPARLRESYQKGLNGYLAGGDGPLFGRRVELSAQRANGEEFPAELAISVVQGPEGACFICYLRDITERKQAEEQRECLERQLRQAQRMEAIGHLTGGIAHDFNNLLTSMLGYTVMAEEHAERLGDERLGQYLGKVQRSAEKARDLIQQMLTFSRGSRGLPQPVGLDSLIGDFIRLLESTLPATVEIDTQLSKGLPLVLVDPVQLEQVLMNLCINARDAMGSVGQLHIGLHRRTFPAAVCSSCQQAFAGDYLVLSVRDSGAGIDPAVQTRMFEPFFTTKALGQGSGMGLSMVHGIVHEYGGHILLRSAPGQGTGFEVLIPPMAGTSSCSAGPHRLPNPDAVLSPLSGRVVVVDDEPLVAEFMAERLMQWGVEVRVFSDPQEASALLLADPYAWDFVILDQSMPRLTGLQLARRLLAARADMPIALYSGFSDELTEAEVITQGLKALLHKPLDQVRLHALLRLHLPHA